jgi:hypothetical protein
VLIAVGWKNSVRPGVLSSRLKWPGREANRSPPSSAKNAWSYTSTDSHVHIVWCFVSYQGQLYLLHCLYHVMLKARCLMRSVSYHSK